MQKRQGRTITNDNLSLEIFLKKKTTNLHGHQKFHFFKQDLFCFNFYCFGIVGLVDGNGWYTVEEVGGGWRCRFLKKKK